MKFTFNSLLSSQKLAIFSSFLMTSNFQLNQGLFLINFFFFNLKNSSLNALSAPGLREILYSA